MYTEAVCIGGLHKVGQFIRIRRIQKDGSVSGPRETYMPSFVSVNEVRFAKQAEWCEVSSAACNRVFCT